MTAKKWEIRVVLEEELGADVEAYNLEQQVKEAIKRQMRGYSAGALISGLEDLRLLCVEASELLEDEE